MSWQKYSTWVELPSMKSHCPSHDILTQFVEATLSDAEVGEVVAHLDCCVSCSQFVERLERKPDNSMLVSFRELQGDIEHDDNTTSDLPRRIGQYEILQKIGQGGMGVVYRAIHLHLKREVALKVIRNSHIADSASRDRFVQEMQSLGQLSHPNIVQATDAGIDGDSLYLVMELLDGEDLGSYIAQHGRMLEAQAIDCIRQTAKGLAFAHKAGYIHRDIKPSNLFLMRDGTVKILDLGIARPIDDSNRKGHTLTGCIVGSAEFMAPEQFRGGTVDARSDIFALGQTLHYLLIGSVQKEDKAGVPSTLRTVLAGMTAGIPDQRIASMPDVIAALDNISVTDRPIFHRAMIVVALLTVVLFVCWNLWPKSTKTSDPQEQLPVEHLNIDKPNVSTAENFDEPWLSVQEICEHFGVSNNTVYRWIANNDMPAQKAGRLWRFKKSEVDAWFKNGGASPNTGQ